MTLSVGTKGKRCREDRKEVDVRIEKFGERYKKERCGRRERF